MENIVRLSNIIRSTLTLAALLGSIVFTAPVLAHGGLSFDKDMCKLTVGPYFMHFTGYQPQLSEATEFCEDIPATGQTIIVLDAIDTTMREMPIEFRVVKGMDENAPDAKTIIHLPSKLYPTGSLSIEYDFLEAGQYVGLVLAGDKGQYTSRFPFSVGATSPLKTYKWHLIVALLLLGGLGAYFYLRGSGGSEAK